jgi:hypothetical protein
VRIHFSIDGGLAAFPGLAKPVTIDCDALPPAERAHLHELVDRAALFACAPHSADSALPDARRYTIAVDDGPLQRSITIAEPVESAPLRALISQLRSHARAERRGGLK